MESKTKIAQDTNMQVPTMPKGPANSMPQAVNVETFTPGYIASQKTLPQSERKGK